MSRRRRSHNTVQNTLKDYFVPIVGGVLLLLLIYNVMSGESPSESTETNISENRVPASIRFEGSDTLAAIEYPGGNRETISDAAELYKQETVFVEAGSLSITLPEGNEVRLNRLAEF